MRSLAWKTAVVGTVRLALGREDETSIDKVEISELVRDFGFGGKTVSENLCPGKFTETAASYGLSAGYAFDLTVAGPDGEAWDLGDPGVQERCEMFLEQQGPILCSAVICARRSRS